MPSPLPDEEILNALRSIAPTPPQNLLERWQPPVSRPARSYRPWIAGLVAATVCGVTLTFLPGSPVRPTPTFADMEEAMLQAKTVSWTERWNSSYRLSPDGRAKKVGAGGSRRHWADLRIAATADEGRTSKDVSIGGRTYQISNHKGPVLTYQLLPWMKLMSSGIVTGKPDANRLRTEIIRSVILPRKPPLSREWTSETINGREYLKLTRRSLGPSTRGIWKLESVEYNIWIEPKTRRVFKRETRNRYKSPLQTVEMVSLCEDIRYNETPPDGLFDIRPPVGSRYIFIPQPDGKPSPPDQKAMEAIIRKAERAWNQGDAVTYLSLWRFHYPTNGSSRGEQLAAIRNPNRYRWPTKNRFYRAGARSSGVYTYRKGDAFPPKEPVEFSISGWGLLKEPNGFKIIRASHHMFLLR